VWDSHRTYMGALKRRVHLDENRPIIYEGRHDEVRLVLIFPNLTESCLVFVYLGGDF
jgi:hypothetical protein